MAESLYDHPRYYDLLFGSDWKAEFDFLKACFARHAKRNVERLFEPACGTGRLLVKFAQAGYEVAGNDLNERAVDYCNRRLARHGFSPSVVVADMASYRPKRKFDAAFNTINSFRHLPGERAARAHLECVADSLRPGGLYVLGLHLTPRGPQECTEETWSARRGHLAIASTMRSLAVDRRKRQERVALTCRVYTPTATERLEEQMTFRTYSLAQFRELVSSTPSLEIVETYDFAYDIDEPIEPTGATEDIVWVMRRRRPPAKPR